jgi:hypothetical protein
MVGKLESSVGRRRGVGALVGSSATLEKFSIPLTAGGLMSGSDVGEVVFRKA